MDFTLKDLLDVPKLQALLDTLDEIHSLPSAIIDNEGNILTATAWQDICTNFHRANTETEKRCRESDSHIIKELEKNPPHVIYKCPLGLVDTATPIIVEGHHLGNVFTGQLFTEPPDEERFIRQAREYGFDEKDYLEAMRKVPVISKERLFKNLKFLGEFAEMLAWQGLMHKRQLETETALRKSEQFLQEMQLVAGLGNYELNISTGKWESSDILDTIFGIDEKFVRSVEGWASLIHPDDRGMMLDYFTNKVVDKHHRFDKEYRIIRNSDGAERWVHGIGRLELNAQSQPVSMIGTIQDITEHKRSEEALRQSEEKYRNLVERAHDGIIIVQDGIIKFANARMAELDGSSLDQLVGTPYTDHVHPSELPRLMDIYRRRMAGEMLPSTYETILIRKDGSPAPSELNAGIINYGGKPADMLIIRDITERKKAAEALLEASQFSRQIIDSAREGVVVYGTDLKYQVWNPFMEQLTGIPADEVLGRHPLEVFPFLRDAGVIAIIEKALAGEVNEAERVKFHIPQTGRSGWTSNISAPLRNTRDEIIGVIGTVRDITQHMQAEEAVLAAAREWSASFDAMSDGVSIHDVDHTIINVNQSLCQLLGKTADELIGTRCYQVFHGKDCPIADCPLQTTKETSQRASVEIFEPALNKWLSVSTSPVFDDSGRLLRIVHSVRDITEQRNIENQLRHAQKLEGIGTLAGGIAHDFNNVLNAVVGFASLLQMQMDKADPLIHYADEIMAAGLRGAALTQQILAFSRKQILDMKPVNLNETIRSLEKMLHRLVREDIGITLDICKKDLPVIADAGQIDQVVMNLVSNARDSMPGGGRLVVATEHFIMDSGFIEMQGFGSPGEYALLAISDTGKGMDEETLKRIFEPFYTTKEVGKGTGLGLAVVHGIVKQHNGYINVISKVGRGTIFKIYLPLTEHMAEETEENPADLIKGGTETILIAEDDASLRKLSRTVLSHYGYRVIEAVDGEDAIKKFSENRDLIKLVILDGIMPKKNGKEAFDKIRKLCPDMKAIFMSGYAEDIFTHEGIPGKEAVFIQKPVTPHSLLRKVRETLDG